LLDGEFDNFDIGSVESYNLKVITLPTEAAPIESDWCILGSEELSDWDENQMNGDCDESLQYKDRYYWLPNVQCLTEWESDYDEPPNKRLINFEEFLTIINKQKQKTTNSYGKDNTDNSGIKVPRLNPTVTRSARPSGSAIQGRRSKATTTRRHSSYQAISY
jgi:hypothetical protein